VNPELIALSDCGGVNSASKYLDRGYENDAKKKIVLDGMRALNRDGDGCSGGLATDKRIGNFYE
jgi:hypothetical protein